MDAPFTRADYELLPEGFPAQLVGGSLVKEASPVYGHQSVVVRLLWALRSAVGDGCALPGPVDVAIDDLNVYQPDVSVFRQPPPPALRATETPVVVFEVLSPSSRGHDRGIKRRMYLEAGVEEVWILDTDGRTIERHSKGGSMLVRARESLRSDALSGFALVPDEIYGARAISDS